MSEEKLTAWDRLCKPPKDALKAITGGRLRGMTDVNPQWRYKAMHDVYGPCGDGWRYEITKVWTETGIDGQVFMFAMVNVWVASKIDGKWSDSIPGIGGSMLIEKDKSGLHHNDEAVKMAVTDALSVALKMLGVAADIYMGRWDGSKYKDEQNQSSKSIAAATADDLEAKAPGTKEFLQNLAMDVLAAFDESDESGFNAYIAAKEGMDADEQTAFWGFFDSKKRRLIRDIGDKRKSNQQGSDNA